MKLKQLVDESHDLFERAVEERHALFVRFAKAYYKAGSESKDLKLAIRRPVGS